MVARVASGVGRLRFAGPVSLPSPAVTKKGAPKIIPECTLPLTGVECIDMIITDLCVMEMDRDRHRFRVTELAPGVTREEIEARTTAELLFADEPTLMMA